MRDLVPEKVSALRVWNTAVRLDVFTTHSLSAEANFCHRRVGKLITEWEGQGLVTSSSKPAEKGRKQFRMTNEGKVPTGMGRGADRKREETLHGNMWNAMRMMRRFTPRDIVMNAQTENIEVPLDDASAYCRLLARGDDPYLKVKVTAIPGKREATYQLIKKTGPYPPRERRIRAIYDPNMNTFVPLRGQS